MRECLREDTGCCFSEVPDLHIHKGTDSFAATCGFGSEQGPSGHIATRQQGYAHVPHFREQKIISHRKIMSHSPRKLQKLYPSKDLGMTWSLKEKLFGKTPVHTICKCPGFLREPSPGPRLPRRWLLELVRAFLLRSLRPRF